MSHTEGRTQRYEEVPQKLAQAVQIWHRDDPKLSFVLSLGDIIDGRATQVSDHLCFRCRSVAATNNHPLKSPACRLKQTRTSLILKTSWVLW